jgi:hypothetical protein
VYMLLSNLLLFVYVFSKIFKLFRFVYDKFQFKFNSKSLNFLYKLP